MPELVHPNRLPRSAGTGGGQCGGHEAQREAEHLSSRHCQTINDDASQQKGGGFELAGGQDSQIKGWWALGNVPMAFEGRQWWVILTVDFEGCADLHACSPFFIFGVFCAPRPAGPKPLTTCMAPVGFSHQMFYCKDPHSTHFCCKNHPMGKLNGFRLFPSM